MSLQNPQYPVRLEVEYPERLSRLLIFVKGLLAIPHFFALTLLGIGALVAAIIGWFAVLFTGRWPEGLFNYITGVMRWGARLGAYIYLLTDRYPPFTLAEVADYPVHLQVDYPEQVARWRPLLNWLLAIPVGIAMYVILLVGFVAMFVGWFAILITGRLPQGLFNAVVVMLRWTLRLNVFQYWMTEQYPPFVWA